MSQNREVDGNTTKRGISAENKKIIKRLVLSAFIIVAVIGIIYLILRLLGLTKLTEQQIQDYVESTGAVAPLVFIAVSFLQVTFVPIPGAITIVAGNYLFGTWLSFLYSYIGMLLGAMFAFFLGKKIGRPFANWIVGSKEKVDEWLKRLKGKQNVVLFFMFFLPFFPDDILCTVAGLLPITYGGFLVMQVITRATSIGFTLLFMSGEVIPYEGWGLVVLAIIAVICIVAFVLSMKYSQKINDFFVNKVNSMFKRKSEKYDQRKD
ncbi:MAG: TVP38/TMEM64 family protein [Clostridiales bacterium]|nr:TVP38/TMEM64 family protein [Clostridiales bacterium]